nr:RNA-dependent RNA polymerase [Monilinia fructicola mitovirus 6]
MRRQTGKNQKKRIVNDLKTKMKKRTYQIVKTICEVFLSTKEFTYVIGLVMGRIHKLLKHNGTLWTVTYLKQARLHVTRFYCGSPLKVNNKGVSLDKDGFPSIFKECKPLIQSENILLRKFVFTLINISRTIKPRRGEDIPVSLDSITQPWSGKFNKLNLHIMKKVLEESNIGLSLRSTGLEDLELTTKSGPHGPQTLSALYSMKRYNAGLASRIMGLLSEELWKYFKDLYTYSLKMPDEFTPKGEKATTHLRRLAVVKDPECKMRVVAMFDWWSQIALKSLSDALFKTLSCIDSDRTYTQDPHFHWKRDPGHLLWSIDLTAATDRFPIQVQEQVLSLLTNRALARDWADMMTGDEFAYKGRSIAYAVGQPMGAYSSWPMFTLTHHVLVRYAAYLNGISAFNMYMVLGDDIVINHNKVAKTYIRLLRGLGVEPSPTKTHVSKHTYEFAKRWIDTRHGEITGLPVRGLIENIGNMPTCYQVLFDWIQKGNQARIRRSLEESVTLFLHRTQEFSKSPLGMNRIHEILRPISFFMRLRFGWSTDDEVRNQIAIWSRNSEFMLVGAEKWIRSEVLRVFDLAYASILQKSSRLTMEFYHKINEFVELEDNIIGDHVHPILQCLENHMVQLVEKQQPRGTSTLSEMCDSLTLMDIENVMSHARPKVKQMASSIKLAHKFVSMIRSWKHDGSILAAPMLNHGGVNMKQTLDRFRRFYL